MTYCGFLELGSEFCHTVRCIKNKRLGKHNLPVWGNMVWKNRLLLLIPSARKPKQVENISRKNLCQRGKTAHVGGSDSIESDKKT